jgi:hypothetical protein
MIIDYYTGFERGETATFEKSLRAMSPLEEDGAQPETAGNPPIGKGTEEVGVLPPGQTEALTETGPRFAPVVERLLELPREW